MRIKVYVVPTLLCMALSCCFTLLYAQVPGSNPIIRNVFSADPAALVHNGRVYLYVGRDEAKDGEMFTMNEWLCYSSTDMKNWTYHGPIMKPTDFKWARGDAWAAQVVERNGKFYFYVTVTGANQYYGRAIGVAVSDSPTGPFVDAKGSPLVYETMTQNGKAWDDIDPTVFIDDDGSVYMAWGNPFCYFAKLKSNMIELDGPIRMITPPNYGEGPWLHKRNGIYYLTYAAFVAPLNAEQICYATATNINGPWTYQGILTGPARNSYTIHPSIIDFKGQSYFFYHNAILTLNGQGPALGRRSVCVEYLCYNPDGTIKPITQTTTGVSGPLPCPEIVRAPFKGKPHDVPGRIEAEEYDFGGPGVSYFEMNTNGNQGGADFRDDQVDIERTSDVSGDYNIAYILEGEWLEYSINVAESGSYRIGFRVAANDLGKACHIEINGIDITGKIEIPSTGGWQNWATIYADNVPLQAGNQIIRVVFDASYMNFNYMTFARNQLPVVKITSPDNNSEFNSPESIVFHANASDADGSIERVEFYAGTNLLGTVKTEPYSWEWKDVQPGRHMIAAKAYDNLGLIGNSELVSVSVQAPFGGKSHMIPGRVEAEEYDLGGMGVAYYEANANGNQGGADFRGDEVDIERTQDTDGGYNIAYILEGEWLEYTVDVMISGVYDMDIRVAAEGEGKKMRIQINGTDVSTPIHIPDTRGWQNWETVTVRGVALAAGRHIMRIVFDDSYMNLNYVEFRDVITGSTVFDKRMIDVYPNPFSETIALKAENGDRNIEYIVINSQGVVVESGVLNNYALIGSGLDKGTYILKLKRLTEQQVIKLIKL